MSTKQAKTNTINTKSSYFILDGFIYETDLKTITRKEKLADCLDLPELKNKLLYPTILKQLQLYMNDGFTIASIKETNENFTTRTVKIENKKEKIMYKNELLKVVKINLKNNTGGSSCLTAKYEPIPENSLNLINRPELAKSVNLIKASCFMSKYADLRNYGKTINKKASSAKYIFLANIYGLNFYTGNDFKINDYGDKKSGSLSLFCEIANNFYYLTSNLGNEAENKKTIENLGKQEIIDFLKKHYDLEIEQNQFNFIRFAIYYLIANLEQEKQVEKPTKNLLPVLYKTEEKTPLKSTKKPLQIELKNQVLSLPVLRGQSIINYSPMIQKIDKAIISTLPVTRSEQIELADYTEIAETHKEGNIKVCGALDNFYELYYARLKEKRAIRKANSKIAGIFNRIMQFSAAAVLCFLFVSTYFNIQKTNLVMDNIAKIETTDPAVINMADLSDCNNSSTSYYLDNEPAKNGTSDGLKWISLAMFGIVRNKRKTKKQVKQQIETYVLVLNEVKHTAFVSRKVKDKIKSAKHKIKLLNEFF